ncbi:MAG: ABC transporter substrate-binding protein [Pseudomonadota bacterium]
MTERIGKRPWAFILIFVAAVFILWELQSQGRFFHSPDLKNSDRLALAFSMPLVDLNSTRHEYGVQSELYPFIHSFLITPDHDGNFSPDLAAHWSSSEDGRTWNFTLRPDAFFHDGRAVSAEDAAASIQKMISLNPVLTRLATQATASSSRVLTIRLSRPTPNFLYYLSLEPIVPRRNDSPPRERRMPVGSGPFRLQKIESPNLLVLTAFEKYYGPKPSYRSVEVRYIPSRDRIWADFLKDRIQACWMSTPETVLLMRTDPTQYRLEGRPDNRATIMLFNNQDQVFGDRRVRRALASLLDMKRHVAVDLLGMAEPCSSPLGLLGQLLPPVIAPEPDPRGAREYLDQAGWIDHDGDGYRDRDGKVFEFELLLSGSLQTEIRTAEEIQLACNAFGLKCHLRVKPYERLIAENLGTGDFQACLTQANTNPHSPYLLALWWGEGGRANFGGYRNPKVEQALRELDGAASLEELREPLEIIRRELSHDQPAVWLYHCYSIHAFSRRLAGLVKPKPTFYQTFPLLKTHLTPRVEKRFSELGNSDVAASGDGR